MDLDQGVSGDVWNIFDLVKVNLTDLMVKGVDTGDNLVASLMNLKGKLANLNMTSIVDLIGDLACAIDERRANAGGAATRSRISSIMMRIMTLTRLFESQLNVEMVKRQLLATLEAQP